MPWSNGKQENNDTGYGAVIPFTASDTVNITGGPCRAIFLPAAGTIKVTMADDTAVTFTTLPAGIHDLRIVRVWATPAPPAGVVLLK